MEGLAVGPIAESRNPRCVSDARVGSTNVNSHVLSMRNLYKQNALGLNIDAGRDAFPTLPGSNGSRIHFTSVDDGIFDNVGTSAIAGLGGGGLAIAGLITNAGTSLSSNNSLDLQFLGTRWHGNLQGTTRRDLQVYGSLAAAGLPGTNDTASTVTIIGSNLAFNHTNVGIDPLPEELFSPDDPN